MMCLSFFKHTRARITLINVFKHEISVARQRYRLGTTHFATLKSFTQYFDKKQSSEETPSYSELHITFSERSLQKVTQYSRNTTPVDTELVTATGTAVISILRLGRLYFHADASAFDFEVDSFEFHSCFMSVNFAFTP